MFRMVPMTDEHLRLIEPQNAQRNDAETIEMRVSTGGALRRAGAAWSALEGDVVLAVGGVAAQGEGRAVAWSLLSIHASRHMTSITRYARRYLDALDYRRIELYVDTTFAAGVRWAEMLGFENETPNGMRGFMPNGNAAYMFGRVR